MKKTVLLALLVIVLAFAFIGCDNANGVNEQTFTVTIGALQNGVITAIPTRGFAGTEVTLTIVPDDVFRLKTGTQKHGATSINETTLKFYLPAENVTVTAEFVSIFYGTWKANDGFIFTFGEDVWGCGDFENGYFLKGTWIHETNNFIVLTITHVLNPGLPSLNDFTHEHEVTEIPWASFNILSSTSIEVSEHWSADRIFNLIH